MKKTEKNGNSSLKNGDRIKLLERFETGDHKHDYQIGSSGTVDTHDGNCAWVNMDCLVTIEATKVLLADSVIFSNIFVVKDGRPLKRGDRIKLLENFRTEDCKHHYSSGSTGTVESKINGHVSVKMDSPIVVSLFKIERANSTPVLC